MRSALLLALALVACNPEAPVAAVPGTIPDAGELVMTVNGTPVGRAEMELVFRRMRMPPEQAATFIDTPGGRHVAEEYALATVLYEKAVAAKLYEDPEVALQMAFAERQVLGQNMRDRLAKAAVTDEAVKAWYEQNKARFEKPEAKVRQIQVTSESMAKDLMERIKKGEEFGTLAKAHSSDPVSAARGGDLGWIRAHENTFIGDAALAADKGALIGPVESRLGFHVVEVLDKRDRTPLEDVRAEAEDQIAHAEATRQLEDLRSQLKIEWAPGRPEVAPPPMQGGPGSPHAPGGGLPPNHPPPGGAAPPPGGGQP